jgi:hypothetical protein
MAEIVGFWRDAKIFLCKFKKYLFLIYFCPLQNFYRDSLLLPFERKEHNTENKSERETWKIIIKNFFEHNLISEMKNEILCFDEEGQEEQTNHLE